MLHQLLCLCKTCNDFCALQKCQTTVSFLEAQCRVKWGGRQEGGCRLTELFQRVFTLCVWLNLLTFGIFWFPSLILGGFQPVSLAHLSLPTLLHCVLYGVSAALGAVVFGHIVGHPVDFGGPALSQSLVKFLTELLQRLVVCFTQSQRVLTRNSRQRGISVEEQWYKWCCKTKSHCSKSKDIMLGNYFGKSHQNEYCLTKSLEASESERERARTKWTKWTISPTCVLAGFIGIMDLVTFHPRLQISKKCDTTEKD